MTIECLKIPRDIEVERQLTPFEQKRKAARTYDELVDLGYEEGMDHPEAWAERVLEGRN